MVSPALTVAAITCALVLTVIFSCLTPTHALHPLPLSARSPLRQRHPFLTIKQLTASNKFRSLVKAHVSNSEVFRSSLSSSPSSNATELTVLDATTEPDIGPAKFPRGYLFDPCLYHKDCVPGYLCIRGDLAASCSGGSSCICMKQSSQLCDADCAICENYPNESCVYPHDDNGTDSKYSEGHEGWGICGSTYAVYIGSVIERGCDSFPGYTPIPDEELEDKEPLPRSSLAPSTSPSPVSSSSGNEKATDSAVCIDAKAMTHLPSEQWVFSAHRRAAVLCDAQGSCATSGHIVVWKGRPMTMLQYCNGQQVGCTRRVTLVNSPRMTRRGLRIHAPTVGLQYTALAARFETRIEKALLTTAIRLGW